MPLVFPAFPDYPQHRMTTVIGAALHVATFTWRERLSSWYLDLALQDGTELVRGRRLSPSWGPLLGLVVEEGPDGVLWVSGPDTFDQADLGGELQLLLVEPDELLDPDPDPDAPRIVKVV